MKRGLITWDQERVPPNAFATRMNALNELMERYAVPALAVYTDVWRSNDVRYASNYMPYWNRAFAVLMRAQPPVLLCSLSPRVYPWIKTVTIHETIVPSPNLPIQLLKLATDRGWPCVGFLDFEGLPHDLYVQIRAAQLQIIDIPRELARTAPDAAEIAMHRQAAVIAREALDALVQDAIGMNEFTLIGRIERLVRRAGAEDLITLVSDGNSHFRPASGEIVGPNTSIMAAVEYSGHWAKVSRNLAGLVSPIAPLEQSSHIETLSASYPWEPLQAQVLPDDAVVAFQVELDGGAGARLFYGETCLRHTGRTAIL
ncbi:MAG TPA: hypothetical protein VGM97_20115 [Steroidobacteraceae bacterium]|jgi:hypothetical protein